MTPPGPRGVPGVTQAREAGWPPGSRGSPPGSRAWGWPPGPRGPPPGAYTPDFLPASEGMGSPAGAPRFENGQSSIKGCPPGPQATPAGGGLGAGVRRQKMIRVDKSVLRMWISR